MALVRQQQKDHMAKQERLKKQQQQAIEQLMAKYETTKSNKLKQSAKDMEKLQTNQKKRKGNI